MPDKNYANKDFKFKGRIILELYANKCCICSQEKGWIEIHHIDKNNSNNDYKNLIPVCKDCHMMVHSKRFTMNLKVDERVIKVAYAIEILLNSDPLAD